MRPVHYSDYVTFPKTGKFNIKGSHY